MCIVTISCASDLVILQHCAHYKFMYYLLILGMLNLVVFLKFELYVPEFKLNTSLMSWTSGNSGISTIR